MKRKFAMQLLGWTDRANRLLPAFKHVENFELAGLVAENLRRTAN